MNTMNDGGPASEMSIRDHFAAAPMSDVELETLREAFVAKFPTEPPSIARIRFFRADTMLEVREKWYNENRTPIPLQEPDVGLSGRMITETEAADSERA